MNMDSRQSHHYLPPASSIIDDVWTRRLASIGAWIIFVLCAVLTTRLLLAETIDLPRIVANFAISAVGLTSLTFLHFGRQRAAVLFLIAGGWSAITLLVSVSGGLYSNNVIVYPLLILLAGQFLGSRISAALTAASMGIAAVFAYLHANGAIPSTAAKPLIFPAASFLATVSMAGIGTWFLNRSLEEHIARQQELTAARVRAEHIALRRERQLNEIADNIPGVVFQFYRHDDGSEGCHFVSPRASGIFGIDPEPEHFLRRFTDAVHPDDRMAMRESIAAALRTGTLWTFEGRLQSAGESNGPREIWFRGVSSPSRHDCETVLSGILIDITEQKLAEQRLLDTNQRYEALNSELEKRVAGRTAQLQTEVDERKKIESALRDAANRLQQIIDTIDSGLLVWSPDQTLNLWNKAFTRIFPELATILHHGMSRQALGEKMRALGSLVPAEQREARWDVIGNFEVTLPDGKILEINRIETPDGGRLVMHSDVTELRRHREALTRNERMAALGGLVAGVAHEINTPLGNALMVTTTLEDHLRDLDRAMKTGPLRRSVFESFLASVRESNDQLHRNLVRSADLIKHFKQVAVDQTSDRRREFDLSSVLENIRATVASRVRKAGHTLDVECPERLRMDSYPGALGQIVTNLVENAITHGFDTRTGGRMTLTVSRVDKAILGLIFADDGIGIASEHLSRVFDPFFTTRLGQGGSGLGLAILLNLTRDALGGEVSVDSSPGKGTRFTFLIPRRAPERPASNDA